MLPDTARIHLIPLREILKKARRKERLYSSGYCRTHQSKKKLLRVTPWLIFFLASPVFSQSAADKIEALLHTEAVTYAQTAHFVLEAADVTVTADAAEAFRYATEHNWLPKNVSANDTARLDGIALLVMRSFGIKGGLLYSLAKRTSVQNSHYAYRELVYRDIIQGRIDPAMPVSGETLLYITGRVFSQRDEEGQP